MFILSSATNFMGFSYIICLSFYAILQCDGHAISFLAREHSFAAPQAVRKSTMCDVSLMVRDDDIPRYGTEKAPKMNNIYSVGDYVCFKSESGE